MARAPRSEKNKPPVGPRPFPVSHLGVTQSARLHRRVRSRMRPDGQTSSGLQRRQVPHSYVLVRRSRAYPAVSGPEKKKPMQKCPSDFCLPTWVLLIPHAHEPFPLSTSPPPPPSIYHPAGWLPTSFPSLPYCFLSPSLVPLVCTRHCGRFSQLCR